jgi:hypothetical protein
MAKPSRKTRPSVRAESAPPKSPRPFPWLAAILAAVLAGYLVPLLSDQASIQWDAADLHYSAQRYFAARVLQGSLPHWTPYLFSGFPFLADPQTGGWYPLNWPFFLTGPGPKAIQAGLALHALLAAAGAFLLFRRWFPPAAAAGGALCYALGGFFAGHSSHVGMFQTAALSPWLLFSLYTALGPRFWRGTLLGAAAGGMVILAGHFQTALYSFAALFLAALACRGPWKKTALFLALTAAGSLLLSGIQTLPGLELAAWSIRASTDARGLTEGVLAPGALATLVWPDALGAISGPYRGPGDVTQSYFYSGLLLLPLAALGLRDARARWLALPLAIPALLYMAGPAAGVYSLIAALPGFRQVRAPVHAWFVAALAFAALAAAGIAWTQARWRRAGPVIAAVLALDLCALNLWTNPLAYARASFDELYGNRLVLARQLVLPAIPAGARLDINGPLNVLGPMNHPLDLQLEAAYGYNPLQLARYERFRRFMENNPRLRDALAVRQVLDPAAQGLAANPTALPLAWFPPELAWAPDEAAELRALATLDPRRTALLTGPPRNITQDPAAQASAVRDSEQSYLIRYRARTPSVLHLSIPYFPGWQAEADGAPCPLLRAGHALTAVIVPAGDKELRLRFQSNYFAAGASLSAAGLLLLAVLALLARKEGSRPHSPAGEAAPAG